MSDLRSIKFASTGRLPSSQSEASLTTSRQATSLDIRGKKLPSSRLKDGGVSAFLAFSQLAVPSPTPSG